MFRLQDSPSGAAAQTQDSGLLVQRGEPCGCDRGSDLPNLLGLTISLIRSHRDRSAYRLPKNFIRTKTRQLAIRQYVFACSRKALSSLPLTDVMNAVQLNC